jgi:Ca2+-binding RTX toxin-like protein
MRTKRTLVGLLATSLALGTPIVIVDPALASPIPETQALADALDDLQSTLGQIANLEELADAIPLSDISPSGPEGLDVIDALSNTLGNLPSSFVEEAPSAVQDELEGLDADVGGVHVVFGCDGSCDAGETPVSVTDNSGVISLTIPVELTRSASVPLTFDSNVIDLTGDPLTIELAASTTLSAEFDTAQALSTPLQAFRLTTNPTITASADATAASVTAATRIGVADATATLKNLAVHAAFSAPLADPDNQGGITREELTVTQAEDFADVTRTGTVAGTIEFDTSLIGGSPDAGPFDIGDANLGDGYSFTLPGLGDLGSFSLISPEGIIAGIGQAAAALGGGQAATDPKLPFLGGTVRRLVQASRPVLDVVDALGVVCGTENVSPPTGSVEDLAANADVYCQAFVTTGVQAGSVSWASTVATIVENGSGANADGTVGVGATKSAHFKMTAPGDFDATVAYTATFDDDNDGTPDRTENRTSQRPPRTIQQIAQKIDDLGNFDLPAVQIPDYNTATKALKFKLTKTFNGGQVDLPLDVGDKLENGTGLVGLKTTNGSIQAAATGIKIDLTPGVLLLPEDDWDTIGGPGGCPDPTPGSCDDPNPLDLFFVEVNPTGAELEVQNATFTLNAPKLAGQLGYLGVTADVGTFALQRRDTNLPLLRLDLAPAGAMTVNGSPLANAIRLRELLFKIGDRVNLAPLNLKLDGALTVKAELSGTTVAQAGVSVSWPDVTTGVPTVTPEVSPNNFLELFSKFNPVPNLFGTATGGDADSLQAAAANFPDAAVNAVLENVSDGSSCTVAEKVSATELRCTAPGLTGGTDNTWTTGDVYRLRVGNPLALLETLLDNLDQIAAGLDTISGGAVSSALDTELPLIGASPRELLAQIKDVKRAVTELKGGPGPTITCGLTDGATPTGDPSQFVVPAGGTTDVYCVGATVKPPTDNTGGAGDTLKWTMPSYNVDGVTGSITANGTGTDANGTVGQSPSKRVKLTFNNGGGAPKTVKLRADDAANGWRLQLDFTDADGKHDVEFPSLAQPGTVQKLEQAIEEKLGLDPSLLTLSVQTIDSKSMLVVDLRALRCTSDSLCGTGLHNALPITTKLAADFGAAGGLVDASADGNITLDYSADARLKLGVALNGTTPEVYVLPDTGLMVKGKFESSGINLQATIGPFQIVAGTGGKPTNDGAGVVKLGAQLGVTGPATATPIGTFLQNLGTNLTPTFSSLGDVNCGDIVNDDGVAEDPEDDPTVNLQGLACARLSLGVGTPGSVSYAGDVGASFSTNGTTFTPNLVIPQATLNALLANALDIKLLLKAIPELLGKVEAGLRASTSSATGSSKLPFVGDALDAGADVAAKLKQAADAIVDAIPNNVSAAADVGNLKTNLADFINTKLGLGGANLLRTIDGTVGGNTGTAADVVVIATCGGGPCADGALLPSITDLRVIFRIGQGAGTGVDGEPFDVGLDGVPLRIAGSISAQAGWSVLVDVGLSKALGPYLGVKGGVNNRPNEVQVDASIGLGENEPVCSQFLDDPLSPLDTAIPGPYDDKRCLGGQLAFLAVNVRDGDGASPKTKASLASIKAGLDLDSSDEKLALTDLLAGDVSVNPYLDLAANINLRFRTGIYGKQAAGFPSVAGTFHADWSWKYGNGQSTQLTAPTVSFEDLYLDLGPFVRKFLQPIVQEVRKYTGPFKPFIDTLMAPIPVVSDLAALVGQPPVTLLGLMSAISGNDLSLIESIAAFIKFVNDAPLGDGLFPLGVAANQAGSFSIDAAKAKQPQSPLDADKLIQNAQAATQSLFSRGTVAGGQTEGSPLGSSGFQSYAGTDPPGPRPGTFGVPGLTFPFMDQPTQIFGLLMGKDITLIRYDFGTLQATAGFSYTFPPIFIGPVPIGIGVGGSVTIKARFAIGYDTSGLRKVLAGGSGMYLFDGIFIDDLDAAGNDVPEVSFIGEVYAQAGVSLFIASAGIVAGLRITVDLNLDDSPNPDGKLHIEEIFNKLQNPLCLFEVKGKLEAFIRAFLELNLFITSVRFEFTLLELTLLEFSGKCEPPKPQLAAITDNGNGTSTLTLNMGPRKGQRNIATDEVDEKFVVRPVGSGRYSVSAFGVYQVFGPDQPSGFGGPPISKVVADGGTGSDEIIMAPGGDEETQPPSGSTPQNTSIPFTAATDLKGGPHDDVIQGGDAADTIFGDAGAESGDAGGDRIDGAKGGDTVHGGAGVDTLNGDEGNDTLNGNDDGDKLNGGPGNDTLDGGKGVDLLNGGPGQETAGGNDGNDKLIGGEDADNLEGGTGGDSLFGDFEVANPTDPAVCDADVAYNPADPNVAADKLNGGDGVDVLVGGAGPDELVGGGDDDTLCGNQGDDNLDGDQAGDATATPGDDAVRGGSGADDAIGAEGHDLVVGGPNRDRVDGGPGNDDVGGGTGSDLVNGGTGLDILVGDAATTTSTVSDRAARANGTPIATSFVSNVGTGNGGSSSCSFVNDRANAGDAASTDTGFADCLQAGTDDDLVYGEGGNDQVFAGTGDDVVYAGAGDDNPVRGEAGNDTMYGEANQDTMYGDSGADKIYGNANRDIIRGGIDDDYVEGNEANDDIYGDGAQDDLIGGTSAAGTPDLGDTIFGGADVDVVVGDNGTIQRPGGNDPADGSVLRAIVLLDVGLGIGGGDTIYGELDNDRVSGGEGDDKVDGGSGKDLLDGNAGDDAIRGGVGDDRIVGGNSGRATYKSGSDTIPYDQAPDTGDQRDAGGGYVGLRGDGDNDVVAGDNATIAWDGTVQMTNFSNASAFGNDKIAGDDGQDRLYGQLGGDTIDGNADEDYAVGDLGFVTPGDPLGTWPGGAPKYDVSLQLSPDLGGVDTIDGGDADDHLFGGAANDVIRGLAGDDYAEGNGGQDSIYGFNATIDDGVAQPSDATDQASALTQGDEDDLIGGSSNWTRPGVIQRADVGETIMQGNPDHDVMTGDNATIDRITTNGGADWAPDDVIAGARKRVVTLLDRERDPGGDLTNVSGGDLMLGNAGSDRMFGEGGSDVAKGNANDDFVEGNQDGDWLEGNDGEDDILGGSSALASAGGRPLAGAGADLGDPDGDDAIFGGGGGDVVAGDNGVVIRQVSPAYAGALATAYYTTDPTDNVYGAWLGVTSNRLVRLLDRSTLHNGRYGNDLASTGDGQDVAFGQDGFDWMSGGPSDDFMEGNGNPPGSPDRLFGDRLPSLQSAGTTPNGEPLVAAPLLAHKSGDAELNGPATPDGQDDLVGGSSQAGSRESGDYVDGDGEGDFVLGDNGRLTREIVGSSYGTYTAAKNTTRIRRDAERFDVGGPANAFGDDDLRGNTGDDAVWGQDGNDTIRGQANDDDLFGELGDDTMLGGTGEDAMIGDRGGVVNTLLGTNGAPFATDSYSSNGPPFISYTGLRAGSLDRRVDLQKELAGSVGGPFSGAPRVLASNGQTTGGMDFMRGGPDHDAMHGAFGDDTMNGDSGGDILFGADGADVMWGGRGNPDGSEDRGVDDSYVDYILGGRGGDPNQNQGVVTGGADIIDYLPRAGVDPQSWHDAIASYEDEPDPTPLDGVPYRQHHQGIDWIYGGWDRDVMEGDEAGNGPNDGDRLWDWTGAYNLYVHCNAAYGGYNDIRDMSPLMVDWIERWAFSLGVGATLAEVQNSTSSAYRETALVYKRDVKANSSRSYPTTPGHFEDPAACAVD